MATIIPRYREPGGTWENKSYGSNDFYKRLERQKLKRKLHKNQSKHTLNNTDLPVNCVKDDKNHPSVEAESIDKHVKNNDELETDTSRLGKDGGLSILGGHSFEKVQQVRHVLPKWLAQPTVISTDLNDLKVTVNDLKLSSTLMENLKKNISYYLPVQAEVIPWILKHNLCMGIISKHKPPRDICVSAPTGSGKTLAYVLPIIQALEKRFVPKIRALVVLPVQDLALQVAKVFEEYIKGTNLKLLVTTGGKTPLLAEQKMLLKRINPTGELESRVDILVTTPGRLVEHLEHSIGFDLKHLKFLVIDEADRVIDSMQNNWLYHLEKHLETEGNHPKSVLTLTSIIENSNRPQKLLFSATLSHDPEKLKQLNLFQPKLFTSVVSTNSDDMSQENANYVIGKFSTPAELEEYYISVKETLKPLAICGLLDKGWRKILCFTKSIESAHRLSQLLSFLNPKIVIKEISSQLSRNIRDETLTDFQAGKIDILVSTDLMARGIDIPMVQYVISYNPPKYIKGYIHRAGRTGRAGIKGTAITLATPQEATNFLQKLKSVNKNNVQEMKLNEDKFLLRIKDFKKALKSVKNQTQKEHTALIKTMKKQKQRRQ